jgi:hypothetical protein
LLRVAAKNGSVAEESAWLNEQAPGILDVDQYPAPTKYRLAQIVALEAWYTTLSPEELSRRIDLLEEIGEGLGFDPFKDPGLRMSVLAMRGETDAAIILGLESVFSESVLLHLGWQESVGLPVYSEFGADDRVQEALQRWRNEQVRQSNRVQEYLADLSAAP